MAGELIQVEGTSGTAGFQTVGSSLSLTPGSFVQASASNTVESLMAANEEDYPLIQGRLVLTGTAPSASGIVIGVFVRYKMDGSGEQPAPASQYEQTRIGQFVVKNSLGTYYSQTPMPNWDKRGTFYLRSNDGTNTLTAAFSIRMISGKAAT